MTIRLNTEPGIACDIPTAVREMGGKARIYGGSRRSEGRGAIKLERERPGGTGWWDGREENWGGGEGGQL